MLSFNHRPLTFGFLLLICNGLSACSRTTTDHDLAPPNAEGHEQKSEVVLVKRERVKHRPSDLTPIDVRKLKSLGFPTVTIGYCVSKRGRVEDTKIVESSGDQALDQSIIDWLKRWRFHPGKTTEGVVKICTELQMNFRKQVES